MERLIANHFDHGDWAVAWLYAKALVQDWNLSTLPVGTLGKIDAIFTWAERSPLETGWRNLKALTPPKVWGKFQTKIDSFLTPALQEALAQSSRQPSPEIEAIRSSMKTRFAEEKLAGKPYTAKRLADLQNTLRQSAPLASPATILRGYALSSNPNEARAYRMALRFGIIKDPLKFLTNETPRPLDPNIENSEGLRWVGCAAADPQTVMHDKDENFALAGLFAGFRLSSSPEFAVRYLERAIQATLYKRYHKALSLLRGANPTLATEKYEDPLEQVRSSAQAYLVGMEGAGVPILTELVRQDSDDLVLVGLHGLSLLGQSANSAFPEVERHVYSPNPEIRRSVLHAISAFFPDSERALPFLLSGLKDGDKTVRSNALSHLAYFKSHVEKAAAAMLQVLETDEAPTVRVDAVIALGQMDGLEGESLTRLVHRIDTDPEMTVRERIVEALGTINNPKAVPALLALLAKDKPANLSEGGSSRFA